jgi:hypothetical protein
VSGDVHDLLRWCGLATLNEPELVRAFRLRLQPELDVDAEADVWWFPDVEERSTAGIVLRSEYAASCRAELRSLHLSGDPKPRAAWDLVAAAHVGASPAIQLEEQINWLSVSEEDPAAVVEACLRRALAAVVNEDRQGLVQWAARALPRMPEIATVQPSAWYLEQGARAHMAAGAAVTRAPAHIDDAVMLRLSRNLPTSVLGVLRLGPSLFLGDVGPSGQAIAVARTDPRVVDVVWPASPAESEYPTGERREMVRVPAGTRQEVHVSWGPLTLRTAVGQEYDLAPDDGLPPGLLPDAMVVVGTPGRWEQAGFLVAPDLVVTPAFEASQSPVVRRPNGGRDLRASLVREHGGLALLSAPGIGERSLTRLPIRRRRRPPSLGRRWYGWGLVPASEDGPEVVTDVRERTTYEEAPGSLLVGLVDTAADPASSSGTEGDLVIRTIVPPAPGALTGGPVIVDGEIAGAVVGAWSEATAPRLLANWSSLWALLRPDSADATGEQWLEALVDAAQALAREYHSGFNEHRLPARDGLTEEQNDELRSQAEWMVGAAVADLHSPEDDAAPAEKWRDSLRKLVDLRTPGFAADATTPQYIAALLGHIEIEFVRAATLFPDISYEGGYAMSPDSARRLSLSELFPTVGVDRESGGPVRGPFGDIAELFRWVADELVDAMETPASGPGGDAAPTTTVRVPRPVPTAAEAPPAPRVPEAPEVVDWTTKVAEWPMFTNDRIGSSTCAAMGHLILAWSAETLGRPLDIGDDDIMTAYRALSGYDPTTGSSDRGATTIDAIRLWRLDGVGGHKIAAYKAVPHGDEHMVRRALWLFGGLYLGFLLHRGGQEDFAGDRPWTDVREKEILGGHAVAVVGCDAEFLTVVTWARLQRMSWAYFHARCESIYAVASRDWVRPEGTTPSGLGWTELRAQLRKIRPARRSSATSSTDDPATAAAEPAETASPFRRIAR